MTATIPVGTAPLGVAVSPDGSKVFIANLLSNNVSVIDTAANMVTATIPVGVEPIAFGVFIQPAPRFAGTPRKANCYGKSVSALVRRYQEREQQPQPSSFYSLDPLRNVTGLTD